MRFATSLEAFQREIAAALLGRGPLPESVMGDEMPAPLRFGVYRNNVVGSLARAIEAAFPATRVWAGEERFRATAIAFVQRYPPSRPQLSAYGAVFPEFLSSVPLGPRASAVAALARFEWARHCAYFAADAPILPAGMLRPIAAEDYLQIRFAMHPSVRLASFPCEVLNLWHECRTGNALQIEPNNRVQHVLIARYGVEVTCREISLGELVLLDSFAARDPIGTAADCALSAEPDLDLQSVLAWHLCHGSFSSFDLANAEEMPR